MYAIGSIIAGKYRITRSLGAGGMGAVFKAENISIGRTVAVKLLHPHLADDETSLARFQREARSAASVAHRHIVEVLDMGVESTGNPYIVMEYVRGKGLEEALRLEGRFDTVRAARIAGDILSALAAVHAQGIVHRDLKPENILLTTRDRRTDFVKVLDFGVAALLEETERVSRSRDLTPSGRVMGSPHYTSPEQLRGVAVKDARVDLWAVGVLLYQMLAGVRPFVATKLDELCHKILHDDPPPLATHAVDVGPGLEAIVRRALEKDADRRFESALAMHEALVPFGAEPLRDEDPEPTDTFTFDLRALRERELATPRDRKSDAPRVAGNEGLSGRFTIPARTMLRGRIPQDLLAQAVGTAKPEVHARFVGPMDVDGWYSDAWFDLLERIDSRVGKGDRKWLAEAGREVVRHADAGLFVAATPELAVDKIPMVWSSLFRTGRASVEVCSRGHGRIRVDEQPDARLARSIAFVGVIEEILRESGGQRVDVRLARSAVLGDPFDRFEASWGS